MKSGRSILKEHLMSKLTGMTFAASVAAALLGYAAHAHAADAAPASHVAGQKLDSGLGELPHYSRWTDPTGKTPTRYRVAGEKLDSGLGDYKPGKIATLDRVVIARDK
jgi:hypothetical protein